MVLVDPAIYNDGDAPPTPAPLDLEWDSPDDAHVYLSSHTPWASWDSWMRDIFVVRIRKIEHTPTTDHKVEALSFTSP